MTHTEALREQIQNNLIANACALHHVTGGAVAAVEIPVPGTERVIFIGTRADVARLTAVDAAAICDDVAAESKNSLFRSGAKICAGEIRAAQAGTDQVDSEGGHHD